MVLEVFVEGYENYCKEVEKHEGKTVFAMFCGSKNEAGESWCPDCVDAEPVVKEHMGSASADAVLIHCGVGARDFWKDRSNIFRTDKKLSLTAVPTLLKVGSPKRLVEAQCAKADLVQMFFGED